MALSYKARRRWSLVILLVGLPLYIIAAVTVLNWLDRPSIVVELLVYVVLGVVWAFPLKAIFKGIGIIAGHAEILGGKGSRIDHQHASLGEVIKMHLQGSRIHGHKGIRFIARSEDLPAAEVDLEGGNAWDGTRWGPDFSRIIRKSGNGVGHHHAAVCEALTDGLHTVT